MKNSKDAELDEWFNIILSPQKTSEEEYIINDLLACEKDKNSRTKNKEDQDNSRQLSKRIEDSGFPSSRFVQINKNCACTHPATLEDMLALIIDPHCQDQGNKSKTEKTEKQSKQNMNNFNKKVSSSTSAKCRADVTLDQPSKFPEFHWSSPVRRKCSRPPGSMKTKPNKHERSHKKSIDDSTEEFEEILGIVLNAENKPPHSATNEFIEREKPVNAVKEMTFDDIIEKFCKSPKTHDEKVNIPAKESFEIKSLQPHNSSSTTVTKNIQNKYCVKADLEATVANNFLPHQYSVPSMNNNYSKEVFNLGRNEDEPPMKKVKIMSHNQHLVFGETKNCYMKRSGLDHQTKLVSKNNFDGKVDIFTNQDKFTNSTDSISKSAKDEPWWKINQHVEKHTNKRKFVSHRKTLTKTLPLKDTLKQKTLSFPVIKNYSTLKKPFTFIYAHKLPQKETTNISNTEEFDSPVIGHKSNIFRTVKNEKLQEQKNKSKEINKENNKQILSDYLISKFSEAKDFSEVFSVGNIESEPNHTKVLNSENECKKNESNISLPTPEQSGSQTISDIVPCTDNNIKFKAPEQKKCAEERVRENFLFHWYSPPTKGKEKNAQTDKKTNLNNVISSEDSTPDNLIEIYTSKSKNKNSEDIVTSTPRNIIEGSSSEDHIISKLFSKDKLQSVVKLYGKNKQNIEDICASQSNKDNEKPDFSVNSFRKRNIKRFKKGKVKIFRVKVPPKKKRHQLHEEIDSENLDFDELIQKVTQDFQQQEFEAQYDDVKSLSRPTSFETDETTSECLSTGTREGLLGADKQLRISINKVSKNKELLFADSDDILRQPDKDKIKLKIQQIFIRVLEDMDACRKPHLLIRKQSYDNCIFKNNRLQMKSIQNAKTVEISYNQKRSKPKFCLIMYLLDKIKILLENNTHLTKREIYYQMKDLVNNQVVIDSTINSISLLLDVGQWDLNILAQKGLVYGNLKIRFTSGEVLNCNLPGVLIPQNLHEIVEIQSLAYFILVVEKESIFHKLLQEDLPNKLTRPFIMITGKGFPDLNTQLFLKRLWIIMSIPVFILVDGDYYGINIMLNYRFGSLRNSHVSQYLAIPNARWLGILPSEVVKLGMKQQPLSEREKNLIRTLMQRPYMECNPKIKEELKILIERGQKAGIEGLIRDYNYLTEIYLPLKFHNQEYI